MKAQTQLLKSVKDFLAIHWDRRSPLLIACSGGPDSKALLYLLLECKKFLDLRIHVGHIDHGWREESKIEAEALRRELENLSIPFHLCTLHGLPAKEDAARKGRYRFLHSTATQIGAQAILLGHQMEDQAETVLKRLLEGAPLPTCCGMRPVSAWEGMPLWRPVLGIRKFRLIQWLEARGVPFACDSTNLSRKYLRGRLRTEVLPQLEASFGKSVINNLYKLGERAALVGDFLAKETEALWTQVKDDSSILLSHLTPVHEALLDNFLRKWAKRHEIRLSSEERQLLVRMVREKNTQIEARGTTYYFKIADEKLELKKV